MIVIKVELEDRVSKDDAERICGEIFALSGVASVEAVMTHNRFTSGMMKAPGCSFEFWAGVIGLSDKLYCFDGDMAACHAGDLSPRSRQALAAHMIDLWQQFSSWKGEKP